MRNSTKIRGFIEIAVLILLTLLAIDNIQFHTMISNTVTQINSDIYEQKSDIEELRNYTSELNVEQNVQKRDLVSLNNIRSQVDEISNKVDGLVCILKVSKEGEILECSGSVYEILGLNNKEIIGQDIGMFMTDKIREKHNYLLTDSFKTKILCDRPVTIYGKNKEKIGVELSVISAGKDHIVTIKRV